ncbi:hypothetical protein B1B_12359, partial [mine drainage metagenome]
SVYCVIYITIWEVSSGMDRAVRRGHKEEQLRESGALHPHPERVKDPTFHSDPFFDARDLVQVRYEMVRRVQVEKLPVQSTARAFGVTRPTFYEAQARLKDKGLPGLLPHVTGPRGPHKLRGAALEFVQALHDQEPSISLVGLGRRLRERHGLVVHPSTILRALRRTGKKNRAARHRSPSPRVRKS